MERSNRTLGSDPLGLAVGIVSGGGVARAGSSNIKLPRVSFSFGKILPNRPLPHDLASEAHLPLRVVKRP